MDQKIKIITDEIRYWQKNYLLPDHYCQFLLNLYQAGENLNNSTVKKDKNPIPWRNIFTSILIFFLIALVGYLVFQFKQMSIFTQAIILSGITFFLYGLTALFRNKGLYSHLLIGISSIATLTTMIWIGVRLEVSTFQLNLFLIASLLVWLLSSVLLRFEYITNISLIGLILAYGWMMYPLVELKNSIWIQQITWLPVSIIGLLLSYIVRKRNGKLVKKLFIIGLIAYFGSEIYSILLHQLSSFTFWLILLTKMIMIVYFVILMIPFLLPKMYKDI